MRNEKGFTLIEIIAVLVILGILAAVAIPRYVDMQAQARTKAVEGALAAVASTLTMEYAKGLLNGSYSATAGPTANGPFNVGDFAGGWTTCAGGTCNVIINAGPSTWGGTFAGNTKGISLF